MNSKFIQCGLIGCTIILIIAICFTSGFLLGQFSARLTSASFLNSSRPELEKLFKPYFQAWDAVHNQYVNQPVDDVALMRGSIRGLMYGLGDPHSSYMDPDEYQQQNAPLEGEYTGIGAWVDTSGEYLVIISPMPNSPAEKAGLKSGDVVIAIDDQDMTGINPELVLRKIWGPAGSQFQTTISRKGVTEPLVFKVTRAVIEIPSLTSELLKGNIAYVRLYQYSQKADKEFRSAFQELLKSKPSALIFDLRNNTGGLVETAIQITSEFIRDGTVMIEESGDGKKQIYTSRGNGMALDIPLVVLVNNGSASASEITAGAIQDYQRGLLVGETTYGKGLVQNWIPLQGENGAIRVSIARWLTPNGHQINKNGLTPDIIVGMTEDDYKAGRDPQRDKAVEILLEQIKVKS